MIRRKSAAVITVWLALASACLAGDLLSYVAQPDPSFRWEIVSKTESPTGADYLLRMTSQTWQQIPWVHEIEFVVPSKCDYPETAVLTVTGGHPGKKSPALQKTLAAAAGCPVATLFGIPNQPLFGGKTEDALIAYTFVKALETGDDTWPLLLPMTKAVVRAMDAIQAFSKSELGKEIKGFIVSGASKRGWTTWLTAAADTRRVKAIVPMVYDNLNLSAQMAHQIAFWGKYSDNIDDYTRLGVQDALATDRGKQLAAIVDPWAYRDRITVPKLIINGTDDAYWTLDALNLYCDDLKGPKFVLYVPNAGHGLAGDVAGGLKIINTAAGFVRAVASGARLPEISWKQTLGKDSCKLETTTDCKDATAILWTTTSETLDFQKARWESAPMTASAQGFSAELAPPKKGYLAFFGEVSTELGDRKCTFSTQLAIVGPDGSAPHGK
ncbi:MAG: PhoPQ-activated pathogenicity-related family protein [Armatimonadota bacterium]